MEARLRKLINDLRESFWLIPAAMVGVGLIVGFALVELERAGALPSWLQDGNWMYNGSATGARTLLGAVASSAIAVAGTLFSITIAALSLAAAQMGPRLLRNFTRDRGNQVSLGVFLGTFAYALMVLRSVRTVEEGAFTPHLSLTVGIALALISLATMVYFIGHMASRINVDTVIDLVAGDMRHALQRLAVERPPPAPPPDSHWQGAPTIPAHDHGYLQELAFGQLADWAEANDCAIRLLAGPGDYVFPGAPLAQVIGGSPDEAATAIRRAMALGSRRGGSLDLMLAFRQLVEVAVRALSPGINDPNTAIGALDRLGAALCSLNGRHLPSGVVRRGQRCVLAVRSIDYDELLDGTFHMIRQNARSQVAVLIRILVVLTGVAQCERDRARHVSLRRHADLVLADAERELGSPADLDELRARHAAFVAAVTAGAGGAA